MRNPHQPRAGWHRPAADALELAGRLGFDNPAQLLLLTPNKVLDMRRAGRELGCVPTDSRGLLQLQVESVELRDKSARAHVSIRARAADTRPVSLTAFSNRHHWLGLHEGDRIEVHVRRRDFYGTQLLDDAILVRRGWWHDRALPQGPSDIQHQAGWGGSSSVWLGYAPSNREGVKVTSAEIARAIAREYESFVADAIDLVVRTCMLDEATICRRLRWPSLRSWLQALHFPLDPAQHAAAIDTARLLAAAAASHDSRKLQARLPCPASQIDVDASAVQRVLSNFTVGPPTREQAQAIRRIGSMLTGPFAMRALLEGDVATGKSLVYWVVAVAAAMSGAAVAIVLPRKLLLLQALAFGRRLTEGLGVSVVEVGKSAVTLPDAGAGCVWVGTTGMARRLAQAGVAINLQIVDEQHVLGVDQREAALSEAVNFLEVTATAQPRTVAMALTGGQTVVRLSERANPPQISTRLVEHEATRSLIEQIACLARSGQQVAVVYPKLHSSREHGEAVGVHDAAKVWQRMLPSLNVCVLTGDMDESERASQLAMAESGAASIIVGSTALELGLNLSHLRTVVIVDAQDFGLAQLHQLRGRVARTGGKGQCILLARRALADDEKKRLAFFCATTSGHLIAQFDLDRRGHGSLDRLSQVDPGAKNRQSGQAKAGIFPAIRPSAALLRRAARDLISAKCDLVGFKPSPIPRE